MLICAIYQIKDKKSALLNRTGFVGEPTF